MLTILIVPVCNEHTLARPIFEIGDIIRSLYYISTKVTQNSAKCDFQIRFQNVIVAMRTLQGHPIDQLLILFIYPHSLTGTERYTVFLSGSFTVTILL